MFATNEPKLTRAAQQEIDKLTQKLREVVDADKAREPKLTGDEKAEVATLEARIKYLNPRSQKLEKLIVEKEARQKYFDWHLTDMVIDGNGEGLDNLVSEVSKLKPSIQLLAVALTAALNESSQADSKIKDIKDKARERELREERAK
jgi:hypothetical protein